MAERRVELGVAERCQALAGRTAGGDGGEAFLGVAAVFLDVEPDHRLDRHRARRCPGRRGSTRYAAIWRPLSRLHGAKGGDEAILIHEPILDARKSNRRRLALAAAMAVSAAAPRHDRSWHGNRAPARRKASRQAYSPINLWVSRYPPVCATPAGRVLYADGDYRTAGRFLDQWARCPQARDGAGSQNCMPGRLDRSAYLKSFTSLSRSGEKSPPGRLANPPLV